MAAFTQGSFQPVIADSADPDPAAIKRVVLCSGKLYYDLAEKRAEIGLADTAIVRVERLYPVPADELAAQLARYPAATDIAWAQEEPANMGAWPTMALAMPGIAEPRKVRPISLRSSSAPAPGSAALHSAEHRGVVESALS
jgi:2-oxoglutarate dehydrogenase E1 component